MRSIPCCSAVLPFTRKILPLKRAKAVDQQRHVDPDPCFVAVCGGKSQPAGPAGTNPQNDQFCYGWVSFGGGRPVGMVAVFAILTGTRGERSFRGMGDGGMMAAYYLKEIKDGPIL